MKGWVYIMTSPAWPNAVKIGFTYYDPVQRASELAQDTGAPVEPTVEWAALVEEPRAEEQKLHRLFASQRIRSDKEYFKLCPLEAYGVIVPQVVAPLYEYGATIEKYKAEKARIEADGPTHANGHVWENGRWVPEIVPQHIAEQRAAIVAKLASK